MQKFIYSLSLFLILSFLFPSLTVSAQSWQKAEGIYGGTINLFYRASNNNLFIGAPSGVYQYDKLNDVWMEISNGIKGKSITSFAQNSSGILYAASKYDGVFVYNDTNKMWSELKPEQDTESIVGNREGARIAINSLDQIYLTSPVGRGVKLSTDGGITWNYIGMERHAISDIEINSNNDVFVSSIAGIQKVIPGTDNWFRTPINGIKVFDMAIDSQDNIYAATNNGFYHSTDNGITWINSRGQNEYSWLFGLSIKVDDNDEVYTSTYFGLFKFTTNNSSHKWVKVSSPFLDETYLCALTFDKDNNIYVGIIGKGVYRSSDGGYSWNELNTNIQEIGPKSFTKNSSTGSIFAGTLGKGIFKSTDGGLNWFNSSVGIDNSYIHSLSSFQGALYAFCTDGSFDTDVYKSTNDGYNWVPVSLPTGLYLPKTFEVDSYGNLHIADLYAIYKSSNEGNSWSSWSSSSYDPFIGSYCMVAHESNIVVGGFGHVLISNNFGQDWEKVGDSKPFTSVYAIELFKNHIYAYFDNYGLYSSQLGSNTWNKVDGLPFFVIYKLYVKDNILFLATDNGLFKTIDGTNWEEINNNISIFGSVVKDSQLSCFLYTNEVLYVGLKNGIYFLGSPNNHPIAIISSFNQNIILGENLSLDGTSSYDEDGEIVQYEWLFDYSDRSFGETLEYTFDSPGDHTIMLAVYDDKEASDTTFASVNVQDLSDAITEFSYEIFTLDLPKGTQNSLVSSLESFVKKYEEGNYNTALNVLNAFRNKVLAQYGKKISESDGDYLLSQLDRFEAVLNYLLGEGATSAGGVVLNNYPNPFNPTTTINYSVIEPSQVSLKIYNAIGQEVAVLVDKTVSTGNYNIKWDASHLASGLYLTKLQAIGINSNESKTIIKKMLLVK